MGILEYPADGNPEGRRDDCIFQFRAEGTKKFCSEHAFRDFLVVIMFSFALFAPLRFE
jgi:hypothetical protein